MGFRESWINFLYRAATGTKKTRTLLTPIGVIIFGVFTALFVFAAIIVDRLLHLPYFLPEEARLLLSIPLMALGITISAWSAFHFLKVKGTPVPFNPPPSSGQERTLSIRSEPDDHRVSFSSCSE